MMEKNKLTPKRGWKRLYADTVKTYNTGYGISLGRISGILNLFFTVATFLVVKGFDLSYVETILLGAATISVIMITGYLYLRANLQKAEFSSNFLEQPEFHEQYLRVQRIEAKLDQLLPKEESIETKESKELFI